MEREATVWHSRPADDVAKELETDLEEGLSPQEAQARLERYGLNELAETPRPGFAQLLLRQFQDFLILILIVAAAVSFVLGETVEAAAILAIVVLNAVLGVVQESKAEFSRPAVMCPPTCGLVRPLT